MSDVTVSLSPDEALVLFDRRLVAAALDCTSRAVPDVPAGGPC